MVGRRGPGKKPTNLAYLHGDHKKNPQRVNAQEPAPSQQDITPPSWLSRPARTVWQTYAPDLIAKNVLTAWDVEMFATFCDAAARRRRAARRLERQGEVIELPVFNKNGEQTGVRLGKNPWLLVLREADAQVQRYGARFGLTPSDRADLTIGEPDRDPDADLLTG
ncbi:phage terminase small subunit P27 family [Haloechinothrix sp. YIM 98757]|uniref:Phage terminase small subunit P27 family n=1 Tax=Haloechinothrix aidingensis TaxID=2752311 RepID=A0A838AAM9_9PSEU|nr:phage terminase small subunit P27 family [Haloechinothrix aidingensis]MBA0126294.1 phage terminase small subunit P27 family [Haloechinothrix aidingensis]